MQYKLGKIFANILDGRASLAMICVRMGIPRTRSDGNGGWSRSGHGEQQRGARGSTAKTSGAGRGYDWTGAGSGAPPPQTRGTLPSSPHLGSGFSCTRDRLPRASLFLVGMLSRPRSQPRSQACTSRSRGGVSRWPSKTIASTPRERPRERRHTEVGGRGLFRRGLMMGLLQPPAED